MPCPAWLVVPCPVWLVVPWLARPVLPCRSWLARPAPTDGQAAHGGDQQQPDDDQQRHARAHLGYRDRTDVVDAVAPHRLADELEPDEPENDRQARGQEDQPVEQAADEEVEVTQPEEREQVGGEDQERVTGEAEDRRDGVEGEQHVGHPDRDDQDEQRCGVAAPADPGGQPGPVALGRDRENAACDGQHAAFPSPGRIATAERHPHGDVDEERPEDVCHPGEPVQGHAAKRDEHTTQHEGEQDPEH
jgi:hypothetical protein